LSTQTIGFVSPGLTRGPYFVKELLDRWRPIVLVSIWLTPAFKHGSDGLSDISTTHPEFDVQDTTTLSQLVNESNVPAEDAIIDLLLREPYDSVIVVAVGPLTNIARAWLKDPGALARARRIVVMGGALDAPGNTSATAEFNFFADPKAATIVMDAAKSESINLLLAPLDFTGWHSVPFAHMIHPLLLSGPLLSGPDLSNVMTPLRAFTSAIFYRVRRVLRDLGEPDRFEMHDPAAVWAALAHADVPRDAPLLSGWGTVKRDFVIECVGEYTKGMCVVDRRGGTDKTGAVRSVDGIASSDDSDKQRFGVRLLHQSPGANVLEKEITEKLFWDLPQMSEDSIFDDLPAYLRLFFYVDHVVDAIPWVNGRAEYTAGPASGVGGNGQECSSQHVRVEDLTHDQQQARQRFDDAVDYITSATEGGCQPKTLQELKEGNPAQRRALIVALTPSKPGRYANPCITSVQIAVQYEVHLPAYPPLPSTLLDVVNTHKML
ncbi:hypothetical protein FRC07_007444, partial [Ceratobasidium sp. 392]